MGKTVRQYQFLHCLALISWYILATTLEQAPAPALTQQGRVLRILNHPLASTIMTLRTRAIVVPSHHIRMIAASQSHHRNQKTIMIMKAVAVTKRRKAVLKEGKVTRAVTAFSGMTRSFSGYDSLTEHVPVEDDFFFNVMPYLIACQYRDLKGQ